MLGQVLTSVSNNNLINACNYSQGDDCFSLMLGFIYSFSWPCSDFADNVTKLNKVKHAYSRRANDMEIIKFTAFIMLISLCFSGLSHHLFPGTLSEWYRVYKKVYNRHKLSRMLILVSDAA